MSQFELIIDILRKYKLQYPVSPENQKRILKARKKALCKILRTQKKDSMFMIFVVNLFYRVRRFGISLSLAGSARAVNFITATALLILTAGVVIPVKYYVIDKKEITEIADLAVKKDVKARVAFVVGDVWISGPGIKPEKASLNKVIEKNNIIKTERGAEITLQIGDDVTAKIKEESVVKVASISDSGNTEFKLDRGKIISSLKKLRKDRGYVIKTLNAVAAVRGTEFSVEYEPVKTIVTVTEGKVNVTLTNPETNKKIYENIVSAGFTAILTDRFLLKSTEEYLFLKKKGEIETGKKAVSKPLNSIAAIKEKYNRINIITLYNGKRYEGAIIFRSNKVYRILTPSGVVNITFSKVKRTKTIR